MGLRYVPSPAGLTLLTKHGTMERAKEPMSGKKESTMPVTQSEF